MSEVTGFSFQFPPKGAIFKRAYFATQGYGAFYEKDTQEEAEQFALDGPFRRVDMEGNVWGFVDLRVVWLRNDGIQDDHAALTYRVDGPKPEPDAREISKSRREGLVKKVSDWQAHGPNDAVFATYGEIMALLELVSDLRTELANKP